jgi:hypothetical protein
VAIKEMSLNPQQKEALVAEIGVMRALLHPNIVRYFGSYYSGNNIWVFEFEEEFFGREGEGGGREKGGRREEGEGRREKGGGRWEGEGRETFFFFWTGLCREESFRVGFNFFSFFGTDSLG